MKRGCVILEANIASGNGKINDGCNLFKGRVMKIIKIL
jgi:hypothetical protein